MKNYIILFTILLSFTVSAQVPYPCPSNGNAEEGTLNNWVTWEGPTGTTINLNNFSIGQNPVRVEATDGITPPPLNQPPYVNGFDYFGNFPLPVQGTYCFRLGNTLAGGEADMMSYTFNVTNENKLFRFRYAVSFQDGTHEPEENPAVWFYCVKGNDIHFSLSDIPILNQTFQGTYADLNNPYYTESQVSPNVVCKDWQCVLMDLSDYVGEQVTFVAGVKDCTHGGHWGYMYIDGLCNEYPAVSVPTLNQTEYCLEETIILNGAASYGEDSYWVEIAECDQTNAYVPGGLVVQSNWYVPAEAPASYNVSDLLAQAGEQLECGKRYKVKLAVANRCEPWNESSVAFDVVCPEVDAGEDVSQCCAGEGTTQDYPIGAPAIPGNTYSWTSVPPGYTSTSSSGSVIPTENTAYIVEMTEPNGCVGRDTVLFRFIPNNLTMALSTSYELCDYAPYITANLTSWNCIPDQEFLDLFGEVDYSSSFAWYFTPENSTTQTYLGTGQTIQAPNANGIVTGTYTDLECNVSLSETIEIFYRPGGNELIAPNAFTPDGGGANNEFRILEYGLDAPLYVGDGPAYGIEDFKLRFWNRWGDNFLTVSKADVGRAPNENVYQGDIMWDGVLSNGNPAQDGVYNYTLEMKYCGQPDFERVCLPGGQVNACLRYVWLFCVQRIYGCSNHVTLIR